MLTPHDMKLSRRIKEWLTQQIETAKENAVNGLESDAYRKLQGRVQALRDTLKELEALEKEIREDR